MPTPVDDEAQAAGLQASCQLDDQHDGVQEKRAKVAMGRRVGYTYLI